MAATFELEIATPDRLLIKEQVSDAQVPAANGMIGVLPDHAALISELGIGELSYSGTEGKKTLFVGNGWVEVLNNHVRVLADRAERPDEIDVARAEKSLRRAQDRLTQQVIGGIDVGRVLNSLKRAEARIAAAAKK